MIKSPLTLYPFVEITAHHVIIILRHIQVAEFVIIPLRSICVTIRFSANLLFPVHSDVIQQVVSLPVKVCLAVGFLIQALLRYQPVTQIHIACRQDIRRHIYIAVLVVVSVSIIVTFLPDISVHKFPDHANFFEGFDLFGFERSFFIFFALFANPVTERILLILVHFWYEQVTVGCTIQPALQIPFRPWVSAFEFPDHADFLEHHNARLSQRNFDFRVPIMERSQPLNPPAQLMPFLILIDSRYKEVTVLFIVFLGNLIPVFEAELLASLCSGC